MTPLLSNNLSFRLKAVRMDTHDMITLNYFTELDYLVHVVCGFTLLESNLYHGERTEDRKGADPELRKHTLFCPHFPASPSRARDKRVCSYSSATLGLN